MKQLTIIFIALSISISSYCQKKDSLEKKDTAYVPVFERTDTVRNVHILYCGIDNVVRFCDKASVILKGYAVKNGKGWQWANSDQVQIFGALDEKNKPVYKLIQILQNK
jgi:hypothetical protein